MKNTHKLNIAIFVVIAYLITLLICISSFISSSPFSDGIKIQDNPLYDLTLTLAYKLIFINQTIVFLFFLTVLLIIFVKSITKTIKDKFVSLFLVPAILICAYHIRLRILLMPSFSHLAMFSFYLLAACLLLLSLNTNFASIKKERLIFFSSLSFFSLIFLLILFNYFEKIGLFPLSTMTTPFAIMVITFFSIALFLFFSFFYIFLQFFKEKASKRIKNLLISALNRLF